MQHCCGKARKGPQTCSGATSLGFRGSPSCLALLPGLPAHEPLEEAGGCRPMRPPYSAISYDYRPRPCPSDSRFCYASCCLGAPPSQDAPSGASTRRLPPWLLKRVWVNASALPRRGAPSWPEPVDKRTSAEAGCEAAAALARPSTGTVPTPVVSNTPPHSLRSSRRCLPQQEYTLGSKPS